MSLSANEDALTRLEAAAEAAQSRREKKEREIKALTERGWVISKEAKDAYRPAFQEAVIEAAPVFHSFLESPEWQRIRIAWGKLRGVPTPEELPLPTLYLKGGPHRRRAVFKGEVWSVSPYEGGIFQWTVGRLLTLTRKIHFMQPPQVIFESDTDLSALLSWYEKSYFDGRTAPVSLELRGRRARALPPQPAGRQSQESSSARRPPRRVAPRNRLRPRAPSTHC